MDARIAFARRLRVDRVWPAAAVLALAAGTVACQPVDQGEQPHALRVRPAHTASHRPTAHRQQSAPVGHHLRRLLVSAHGDVVLPGGVILPDRRRTPGATNPVVRQATISRTICRTGYTSSIRPLSSVTTLLKINQLASGYAFHGDRNTSDYEEDHLISLELGGSPTRASNLWPEPYSAPGGARVKDLVENKLHDLVCSGALSLRAAQHAIATNWWRAYQRYGGVAMPHVFEGAYGASSPLPAITQAAAADELDPRFDYCYEAIAHGYGPYYRGRDPEYAWYTDADNDGVVCER